jgi:hypothetical protein
MFEFLSLQFYAIVLSAFGLTLFAEAKPHHGARASVVALVIGLACGAFFGLAFTFSPLFEIMNDFSQIADGFWQEDRSFLRQRADIIFVGALTGMFASNLSLLLFGARQRSTSQRDSGQ